jgi:hypothetical protein
MSPYAEVSFVSTFLRPWWAEDVSCFSEIHFEGLILVTV